MNRFKESRRVHPLKLDLPIVEKIEAERNWLKPLLNINDYYIDTSKFTLNLLKNEMQILFKKHSDSKINLRIISFGYKFGLPREADIVFDMRFLRNPFYEKNLKKFDGKNLKVINFVKKQKYFDFFFDTLLLLFNNILEGYKKEGKEHITIAFGCTGGVHRSVVSSDHFLNLINNNRKLRIFIEHRDIAK